MRGLLLKLFLRALTSLANSFLYERLVGLFLNLQWHRLRAAGLKGRIMDEIVYLKCSNAVICSVPLGRVWPALPAPAFSLLLSCLFCGQVNSLVLSQQYFPSWCWAVRKAGALWGHWAALEPLFAAELFNGSGDGVQLCRALSSAWGAMGVLSWAEMGRELCWAAGDFHLHSCTQAELVFLPVLERFCVNH